MFFWAYIKRCYGCLEKSCLMYSYTVYIITAGEKGVIPKPASVCDAMVLTEECLVENIDVVMGVILSSY